MFYQEESENFEDKLSLKKFESMLKTNKILFFDSEEFENIIFHYMESGKIILAKKAIKIAFEQHPNSINLKILQLELLIFENKLDLAEKMANDLLTLEPQNDEIYIQKANIFSRKNLHQEAIDLLKLALKYTDDMADVYNLIAMEYLFVDDLKNAKDYFILTIENDEEDENALSNIIYCFEILDEHHECILFLEDFINNVNPYSETAWFHQGRMYYVLKDYNNALRCYDYALLANETFIGSIIERGKTLEKLQKYNDAIATYNSALELDDPTAYTYFRIGKCYEKLNKNLLALEYYNKTILEDTLLAKGWLAISKLYLKQKNYQKALFNINKTLEIENENHKYWKIYAFINHKLGFFEEAEHGYRKAVEYGNSELETWFFWVDILIKIGEFERAIKVLLEADEFYQENDLIFYRLAGLYFNQNQTSLFSKYILEALTINFKNHKIIKKIFPNIWESKIVQNYIKNKKTEQ
jgi:tetratricopeptide (TPR) repeat protein